MTKFLLIRHATNDTIDRFLAGRLPNVHLNAEGKTQADKLALRLSQSRIAAIYSSPRERAWETAEPIARDHKLDICCSAALDEMDFGEWTGRPFPELESD